MNVYAAQREDVSFSEKVRKQVKLILRDSGLEEPFEGYAKMEAGYLKTIVVWNSKESITADVLEVGVREEGNKEPSALRRAFRIHFDAVTGALKLEEVQPVLGTDG